MARLLAVLALLFLTPSCWADGMVIPSTAMAVETRIPDQRALIHFTNGVERLVIETRFTGAGTNFAWVVPLPSPPAIEEASTGLFPTLQLLFQPRLRHEVTHYFQWFLGLLGLGYLLRFVRGRSAFHWLDVLACLCVALAVFTTDPMRIFGSVVVFLTAIYVVECVRLEVPYLLHLVTFFFLIIFLAGMLMPALSGTAGMPMAATAAGGTSSSSSVSIIDRRIIGIFDTATISSTDPKALQTWLKTNGFALSANRDQAVASYVKDGWVFVAAKVNRADAALQTATPHPLSFTFKTEKAVYPMRLTGIGNGPLQVELYVFGAERAKARHFTVERCAQPAYPQLPIHRGIASFSPEAFSLRPEIVQIVHPLLRKWVDGAPVATKLTATLTPAEMRDDVGIFWAPFAEEQTTRFSHWGALVYALNWGMGVITASLLAALVFGPGSAARAKQAGKIAALAVCFGGALTASIYMLLPKTDVRMIKGLKWRLYEGFYALQIIQRSAADSASDIPEMLSAWRGQREENFLSGGLIHEEDSPGNYEFVKTTNGVQCIVYDASGAVIEE